MQFHSQSELVAFAKRLEGRRFSEISESIGMLDENHRKHTKGVAAKVVETEFWFLATVEKPDFEHLGISSRSASEIPEGDQSVHNKREMSSKWWITKRLQELSIGRI